MDSFITVEELRAFLKLIGITTEFTDEELKLIIQLIMDYINSLLGGLVYGYNVTEAINTECCHRLYKCGERIILKDYPVHHIININLAQGLYFLHRDLGVLEFTKEYYHEGYIRVTYRVGFDDDFIKAMILPIFLGIN